MSFTLRKNPLCHCVTSPPKGETHSGKTHQISFPRPRTGRGTGGGVPIGQRVSAERGKFIGTKLKVVEAVPRTTKRAVALQYGPDDTAPVVVASGMGYLAEKIVDVAQENGVPVYEDESLATVLTQLNLGQEIPPELYQAIVEIYVYFLNFDVQNRRPRALQAPAETQSETDAETNTDTEGAT